MCRGELSLGETYALQRGKEEKECHENPIIIKDQGLRTKDQKLRTQDTRIKDKGPRIKDLYYLGVLYVSDQ